MYKNYLYLRGKKVVLKLTFYFVRASVFRGFNEHIVQTCTVHSARYTTTTTYDFQYL